MRDNIAWIPSFILLILYLILSNTFLSNAVTASASENPPEFQEVSVHDPSIIKVDNMYYVFGTHIEGASSLDLQSWEIFTNGYKSKENTIYGDLSDNLSESFEWAGEDDADSSGGFAVWAPEVIWNEHFKNSDGTEGAYMIYYSVSSTYIRSAIGYAVSKNIEGPYEYVDTIMYSGFYDHEAYDENSDVNKHVENTNIPALINEGIFEKKSPDWFTDEGKYNYREFTNAIDANLFFDEVGKLWMTYGSWAGGVFILEVDPVTGQLKHPGEDGHTEDGRIIDRYFGTKISGGYGRSGEGPYVIYDDKTNFYYLYVTYGGLGADGGYQIRQFRSEDPEGPYVDATGNQAVLPADKFDVGEVTNRPDSDDHKEFGNKLIGNYLFKRDQSESGSDNGTGYVSPGHNSYMIDDDLNKEFLIFHSRFPGEGESHQIRVHQMFKNSDNWPVPTPYRYAGETVEKVKGSDVNGYYKFINHGKEITPEVEESVWIRLNNDQSITGAVNGFWEKYDDYRVKINLEGKSSYDGVFLRQWDPTKEEWVMTFSGLSDQGEVIWGSKSEDVSEDILPDTSKNLFKWLPLVGLFLLLSVAILLVFRKKTIK